MKTQTKEIDSFTDETLTCFKYSLYIINEGYKILNARRVKSSKWIKCNLLYDISYKIEIETE